MNNASPSEERLFILTRESKEYVTYPRRISIWIDLTQWTRLERCISQIPKTERPYRDLAFASLGVAIPTLVTALTVDFTSAGMPTWAPVLYWCTAIGTLVAFVLCILFDRKIGSHISNRVSETLQEMDEIRSCSALSKEIAGALETTSPTL